MRNNCTIGKLSERNKAGDEEAIHRRNRSCMSGVGVAQPWSELYVQSRTWTVPLHQSAPPPHAPPDCTPTPPSPQLWCTSSQQGPLHPSSILPMSCSPKPSPRGLVSILFSFLGNSPYFEFFNNL